MQRKGSIKKRWPFKGLLLPFYELRQLGVLAKCTFEWPKHQENIYFISGSCEVFSLEFSTFSAV